MRGLQLNHLSKRSHRSFERLLMELGDLSLLHNAPRDPIRLCSRMFCRRYFADTQEYFAYSSCFILFIMICHLSILPISSGSLHWYWDNYTIAPWQNWLCELSTDNETTAKQRKTKPDVCFVKICSILLVRSHCKEYLIATSFKSCNRKL